MKKARYVFGVIAALYIIFLGVEIGFSIDRPSAYKVTKAQGLAPIVRLHEFESGRFFCSGTVSV